jgi:hypothetical protein
MRLTQSTCKAHFLGWPPGTERCATKLASYTHAGELSSIQELRHAPLMLTCEIMLIDVPNSPGSRFDNGPPGLSARRRCRLPEEQ